MKGLITGSSKLAGAIIEDLHGSIVREKIDLETCRVDSDIPWRHFDFFINNAAVDFSQVKLLNEAYENWKDDESKLIINISSRAYKPNISKGYLYAAEKAALNHLADNLTYNSNKKCGIILLNLGLIEHKELPSLTYDDITMCLKDIIFNYYCDNPVMSEITLQHQANYIGVQKEKEELKEIEEDFNNFLKKSE
tara:strand:- start:12823 stop:13404 length:582 start_codon:yes stop_codon:yes gene_type:complete